eukprot:Hpha_TRINITY_DN17003_c3_g3::TRINITY_DN17003_c3_g3_i1::g.166108::m.166108/K08582/CAPN15; calpain-15
MRIWERAESLPCEGSWEFRDLFRWGAGWQLAPPDPEAPGKLLFSPQSISQGELGDCWFLSALAVVATRQELMRRVVVSTGRSPRGVYCFKFFHNGIWTPVLVDDLVPARAYPSCSFSYARPADGKYLWVPLLEKAYAKLHGSYAAICSGNAREALTDLTGMPCETVDLDEDLEQDLLWSKLESLQSSGCLMAASCGEKQGGAEKGQFKERGLVPRHAYTILSVHTVKTEAGVSVKLLRLRNPWGRFEWKGDWSRKSPLWTQALREACKSTPSDPPGTFFISLKDFLMHFYAIDLCRTMEDWNSSSMSDAFHARYDPKGGSAGFTNQYVLSVREPVWAFLTLIQPKGRGADSGHRYIDAGLLVTHEDGRLVEVKLPGWRRFSTMELMLREPGKYNVIPFSFTNGEDRPFVLAVWSSKPFDLERVPPRLDLFTAGAVSMAWNTTSTKAKVKVWEKLGLKNVMLNWNDGIMFIAVNETTAPVTLTLDIQKSRGLISSREDPRGGGDGMHIQDTIPGRSAEVVVVLSALEIRRGYSLGSYTQKVQAGAPAAASRSPPLKGSDALHGTMPLPPGAAPPAAPKPWYAW